MNPEDGPEMEILQLEEKRVLEEIRFYLKNNLLCVRNEDGVLSLNQGSNMPRVVEDFLLVGNHVERSQPSNPPRNAEGSGNVAPE